MRMSLNLTKIIDKIAQMYPNMKKVKHAQIAEILLQKWLIKKSCGRRW